MDQAQIEKLITSTFGFLFSREEKTSLIMPQNSHEYGVYKIISKCGTFKITLDKYLCSMVFWPETGKEEDALPVELLYLYYKYDGLVPSKKDMQHFHSENVNIEKCFQQKRDILLHINRLFQESECPWWGLACSFSKKWIEVELGMV